MLFEVDPDQIQKLDAKQLPQLMARLIFAEAQKAGIPLYHASIPMQINVADGGEDGRIEWSDGEACTDYFPSRFVLFQSKAKKALTASDVKAEIAKKITTKEQVQYKASEAIRTVVSKKGSYVLFTSVPLVIKKIDELKQEIRNTIEVSGLNPDDCVAIEIYDANKIANWVNTHSSVALWVNETLSLNTYGGFLTLPLWGKSEDNHVYKWVDTGDSRFVADGGAIPTSAEHHTQPRYSYEDIKNIFLSHIGQDQKIVRVYGASGFGKSRFTYELFNEQGSPGSKSIATSLIYCNAYIGSEKILSFAHDIAKNGQRTIFVVDDCEDYLHSKLEKLILMTGSKSSLVTINTESRIQASSCTMTIQLEKASDKVIEEIINQAGNNNDRLLITQLAEGFPRMAIIALEALRDNRNPVKKAEEIIHHILWGGKDPDRNALSGLRILCLFEYLGCEDDKFLDLEEVAQNLAGVTPDQMYEGLQAFISRGVVVRIGDYFKAQPLNLMLNLAAEYLNSLSPQKKNYLLNSLPERLYRRFLSQIKWLDASRGAAREIAETLLSKQHFGTLEKITTELGSETISALVNTVPNFAMNTLTACLGRLRDEELHGIQEGRQNIVWTLNKLVFPKATFRPAAKLLLRLAANENEYGFSNNSTHYFCQLYHLYLSGTEVEPKLRLEILDEGLQSNHEPTIAVCLKALKEMLKTNNFTRFGDAGRLGSLPSLVDWQPKTHDEIYDYWRQALERLSIFARQTGPNAIFAAEAISDSIRELLDYEAMFDDVKTYAEIITDNINMLYRVLVSLHSWLYFNSNEAPRSLTDKIKKFAKDLMPSSPVDQLVILTKGYCHEFYNPDAIYKGNSLDNDLDYPKRKSETLAEAIAKNQDTAAEAALRIVRDNTLKSPFYAMKRLAECSQKPIELFESVILHLEQNEIAPNIDALAGFVSGIIFKSSADGNKCFTTIRSSQHLRKYAFQVIDKSNQKITKEILDLALSFVREGTITPYSCVNISHGRRLEHLEFKDIKDFLFELEAHSDEGLVAALEIISLYIHGRTLQMSDEFITYLKGILLNPKSYTLNSNIRCYYLEVIYKKLRESGACDQMFVNKLSKQLFMASDSSFVDDRNVQNALIQLCIHDHPKAVWQSLAEAFENGFEIQLCHEGGDLIEGALTNNTRALDKLPEDLYIPWVGEDKKRLLFVLAWIPLIENKQNQLTWHPKIEKLLDSVDPSSEALNIIFRRMRPRESIGSIIPYLERFTPLLEEWKEHPAPQVSDWAHDATTCLSVRIEQQRKREQEDELRYV